MVYSEARRETSSGRFASVSKLKVLCFSISVDGYGAGPSQSFQNPLGEGGLELQQWAFSTQAFQRSHQQTGGEVGINNDYVEKGFANIGAWIIGRNMFDHHRGPWKDSDWIGWWGKNPPFHCPVFVLTHYTRPPLVLEGNNTFYFVTDGIESALKQAREAAKGRDVRLGGGVATIREYLKQGLVDEMHLAVTPVLLGKGEHLFQGIDLKALGFSVVKQESSSKVQHLTLRKV